MAYAKLMVMNNPYNIMSLPGIFTTFVWDYRLVISTTTTQY